MSKFEIVEIESVSSSVPRSNFKEVDLDILADSILESGGILKPLVLKKIGFEKYEVIDGHFEYYAAVRAREKNSIKGEIVNAFIITSEKEDAVLKQVEFFKGIETSEKIVKAPHQKPEINQETNISELLDEKLKPIYARMNQLTSPNPNPINTEKGDYDNRLKSIENKIENLTKLIEKIIPTIPPPPPPKLKLLTAKNEEIMIALNEVGAKRTEINAALEAIKYWKQSDKTLTWQNLLISTKKGKHKISGFADATYQRLKQIAEIQIE
ncbi:hypothetical protein H6F32_05665 [Anabaena sp. FACHB-1237]|uniref:ParB N-terminal domain-containing protein n=1 Tax=Anabaena sp. FACHB-1237 TaxID=2692769 RepID=UPI00168058CA|nr:hypothetical protein [Anabaena sp. FACHB-1237]MBD2137082.1 hypothetical protein [Anabaena sp. FACHB-1237]